MSQSTLCSRRQTSDDLLNRMFFVRTILENDQALIEDVQQQQDLLRSEMSTIEQKITDISQIKAQLDEQKNALESYKALKQRTGGYRARRRAFLQQRREIDAENKRFADMIRETKRTASGYSGKP